MLQALGVELAVEQAAFAALTAVIEGPTGTVSLS